MPDAVSSFGLDELRKILKQLPPARSDEMIAQNLGLISDISRPGAVLGLLDEVLASPAMLASIARLSYHHVNHFDKIVLIDSDAPTGYRLTLHLWQPPYSAEELEDEIIHSHRFSFWSAILTGTLISENFDAADEGLPFRRYSYVPEKKTKVNFYEFGGDAFLSPTGNTEQSAGTFYYLPNELIHRVLLPTDAMTCTLVLRGPRERNHSDVYNTSYPATDTQTANHTFSSEQLTEKLLALRSQVEIGEGHPALVGDHQQ
jgi:hypothetical protein